MSVDITTIALKADATQIKEAEKALDDLANSGDKASKSADQVKDAYDKLASSVRTLAALFGAYKAIQYAHDAAILSARYETLGIVMEVVGKNAGYTAQQMNAAAKALTETGISMIEARQQTTRLVQAQIDLSYSSKLARIAQDAAVIGNINSSEAFSRLVHGIQTFQTETLRGIGLNISMERAFEQMAQTLGKKTKELSQLEKTQAVVNAVMKEGAGIAGVYEAAMDTAGKQLNSMTRYFEDLKVKIGDVFNDVLTAYVMSLTDRLKGANGQIDEMAKNQQIKTWASDIANLFVWLTDKIQMATLAVKNFGMFMAGMVNAGSIIAESISKGNKLSVFDVSGRMQVYKEMNDALKKNRDDYEVAQTELWDSAGKFQEKWDLRQRTVAEKQEATLRQSVEKEKQYGAIFAYWTDMKAKGLMKEAEYVKNVRELTQSMYGDNHKYTDTTKPEKDEKDKHDKYKSLISSAEGRINVLKMEIAATHELTEAEKLLAKFRADLSTGDLKPDAVKQARYEDTLKRLKVQEDLLRAKKEEEAQGKRNAEVDEANAAVTAKAEEAYRNFFKSITDVNKSLEEETRLIGFELAVAQTFGKTNAELTASTIANNNARDTSIALKRLEEQYNIALIRQEGELIDAYAKRVRETTALYEQQKNAIPGLVNAKNTERAAVDAARKADEAFRETWNSIDQAGRETWRNIFDQDGVSAVKRLANTIKSTILDALYQLTLKPLLFQVYAAATGGAQAFSNPNQIAGMGGGGGIGNLLSSGNSLYNLLSGKSAETLSSGIGRIGNFFQGTQAAAPVSTLAPSWVAGSEAAFGSAGFGGAAAAAGEIGFGTAVAAETGVAAFGSAGFGGAAGAAAEGASLVAGSGAVAGGIGAGAMGALAAAAPYIAAAVAIAGALGLFGGKKSPAIGTGYTFQGSYGVGEGVSDFVGHGNYKAGERTGFDELSSPEVHLAKFNEAIDKSVADFDRMAKNYFGASTKGLRGSFDLTTAGVGQAQDDASKPAVALQIVNQFAEQIIPGLKDMAKENEQLIQTFVRLGEEGKFVDKMFELVGQTMSVTGAEAIKFKSDVVALLGGLDKASAAGSAYYANFYTNSERHALDLKRVNDLMSELGTAIIPKTRAEYRALVEAQDLNTLAGREMFAALLQAAPAFAAVTNALDSTGEAAIKHAEEIKNAEGILRDAYKRERQEMQVTAEKWNELSKSLRGYNAGIAQNGGLGMSYGSARRDFSFTAASAQLGNPEALSRLTTSAENFRTASLASSKDLRAYLTDVARITHHIEGAAVATDVRKSIAEQQLDLMEKQVSALVDISENVVSVDEAIRTLGGLREGAPAAASGTDEALLAEIRQLRVEIVNLQDSAATTAAETRRMAAAIINVTQDGQAMLTETA